MKKGLLGVLVLVSCGLGQIQADGAVLINEILADPAADANGDGALSTTKDEFIELLNTGSDLVELGDWTLSDSVSLRHTFSASSAIPGYGFFIIFGGGVPQSFSSAAIASTGTLSLNNGGDTVSLRNSNGDLVDQIIFGSEGGSNVSLTRSPDGQDVWVKHSTLSNLAFSPGKTIAGLLELPHEIPVEVPQADEAGSLPEEPAFPPLPPLSDTGVPPVPPLSDEGGPVVPEPATWALFSLGATSLIAQRKRFFS